MLIHFAIVGCGKISIRHAVQIHRLGKLVAVCDIDFQKAQDLALKYQVNAYASLEEMLKMEPSIEVISICTPNFLHAQQSIYALSAGKHVLCEKPMSIHKSDAEQMIEVANQNNKRLFIVKSSRYTSAVDALKKLLDSNSLGSIYSFQMNCVWNRPVHYYEGDSWRGDKEKDGGTLYTQFSHYLDVLIWLLGDAEDIQGFSSKQVHKHIDFEDTGAIAVKMMSGAIGTIHFSVNAYQQNHEVSFTIVAEKVTIKLGGEYMNELVYQNPELLKPTDILPNNLPNDYGTYKGSMSNHDKVYENVINALQGKISSFTDGESALRTVSFIEKIYQKIHLIS